VQYLQNAENRKHLLSPLEILISQYYSVGVTKKRIKKARGGQRTNGTGIHVPDKEENPVRKERSIRQ